MKKFFSGTLFVLVALCFAFTSTQKVSAQSAYDCSAQSVILFEECQALVDLYDSTQGDFRTNHTNRLAVNNPCKWYGVTCNTATTAVSQPLHVNYLRLNNNNLNGALPESIGDLKLLEILYVQNNSMCGMLPETLTNLVNLKRANFSYNNFLTNGYSTKMLAFLNQPFVIRLPQANPQSCGPLEVADLSIHVNTSASETEDAKYVLGGDPLNAVPFVAWFELISDNGDSFVEDLTLQVSGPWNSAFAQAATEAVIYDEDFVTVLDSHAVTTNNEVVFNGINLEVLEGVRNVFVKVVADLIGSQYEGTATDDLFISLVATHAEDLNSWGDITPTYDGGNQTLPSKQFQIVPVKFTDAAFVLSAVGVTVNTSISNGPDQNIAILKLTADNRSNTQTSPSGSLKLYVVQLNFATNNTSAVTNYEIKRIGNGTTTFYPCTVITDRVICNLTAGNISTKEFTSWEVGYYQLRADVDAPGNTSVKISRPNLNEWTPAPINYEPSDTSAEYEWLRYGEDYTESPSVVILN